MERKLTRTPAFEYQEGSLELGDDSRGSYVPVNVPDSEGKEDDEEETAFDRDFIKVEKESEDTNAKKSETEESQEEIIELKSKLECALQNLNDSESEKARLQNEVDFANGQLKQGEKHSQDLELELKRLKEAAEKAELEHISQLQSLQKVQEESSKLNIKEMEDKIDAIQQDLVKFQGDLVLSRSRVEELEKKITNDEATIEQLTQELSQCKASEELAKKDASAMESLFTASKEELQQKSASLKEFESKYEREIKINEGIEATLRNQHKQVKSLQEKLVKVTVEKEAFEAISAELNAGLVKSKEAYKQLEDKLNESVQNFNKAESLLKEALSHNSEMEQNLKSVEELHKQFMESATQEKLDLEMLVQSSTVEKEELKVQLRESESKLVSTKQKNVEFEQQFSLLDLKCIDLDRELKEIHGKNSELMDLLKISEEDNALSRCHFQESKDRANQLEISLSKSSEKISDFEEKMRDLLEKCTEYENRAVESCQQNLELENLIEKSHLERKDAESKVAELEILLETTKYRGKELEEQLRISDLKYKDAEEEIVQLQLQVTELKAITEEFQRSSEHIETSLEAAKLKERELTDQLNIIKGERDSFEQLSKDSSQKVLEVENLYEVLQFELRLTKEKLEGVEKVLEISDAQGHELLEKLRLREEELEHKKGLVKQATSRNFELQSLHESLSKDFDSKSQETIEQLSQKESEVQQLSLKLVSAEEQATLCGIQAAEAVERGNVLQQQLAEMTERAESLKAELVASSASHISMEGTIDNLRSRIQEIEAECASYQNETAEAFEKAQIYQDLASKASEKAEFYQKQAAEAAEREASLKSKLEAGSIENLTLEEIIGELNVKIQETEANIEQVSSERDNIARTNSKLKEELEASQADVINLEKILDSLKAEKEEIKLQLDSHVSKISELTNQHSRGLELHLESQSRAKETEAKLLEEIELLRVRDAEATHLTEKLVSLEIQFKIYEKESHDAERVAETRKTQLDEALLKIDKLEENAGEFSRRISQFKIENESLVNKNEKLTVEATSYRTNLNELEKSLEAVLAEKEKMLGELNLKVQEGEAEIQRILSENEIILGKNNKLKEDLEINRFEVHKLQELLNSTAAEKEHMEEKLISHVKRVAELTEQHSRGLELHLETESQAKQTQAKLLEEIEKLKLRDAEATNMSEKLVALESQVETYEKQAHESQNAADVRKMELEEALQKIDKVEEMAREFKSKLTLFENENEGLANKNLKLTGELASYETRMNKLQESLNLICIEKEEALGELKSKVQEAEKKVEQVLSKNEVVTRRNAKLEEELETSQVEVKKLQEILDSIKAEKEEASEQLAYHSMKVSELTDQHSRGLELNLEIQSRAKETESRLLEEIERLRLRDSEATNLSVNLVSLESQLRTYEKNTHEAENAAEIRKIELDKTLLKIENLEVVAAEYQSKLIEVEAENENLANTNLKLTSDITSYETHLNELQRSFETACIEKEEVLGQLHALRKEIDDLKQQFSSDEDRLQSQISSVMEENSLLNEIHQNTKKDLQAVIRQLEEQLNEQKEKESSLNVHIENLKSDLVVKFDMQLRIAELEQQMLTVEKQFHEEFERVKSTLSEKEELLACKLQERHDLAEQLEQLQKEIIVVQKEAEGSRTESEATRKQSVLDIVVHKQRISSLEKQVEECKHKLQETEALYEEKLEDLQKMSPLQDETKQDVFLLQNRVQELEQQLHMVETQPILQKYEIKATEENHDVLGKKSRDLVVGLSAPTKRKSNKRGGGESSSRSGNPTTTSTTSIEEYPLATSVKFIIGIVLLSMVIGAFIGKRY